MSKFTPLIQAMTGLIREVEKPAAPKKSTTVQAQLTTLLSQSKEQASNDEATPPAPSNIVDFSLTLGNEDVSSDAYYYNADDGDVKSGVTIAGGIDLAYNDETSLKKAGAGKALLAKAAPYIGLKGKEAKEYLAEHPLSISNEQATTLTSYVMTQYAARLASKYNKSSDVAWNTIPQAARDTIFSVFWQYGNLPKRAPKFWGFVTSQDWDGAIKELRNFGDVYDSRREREADYLEKGIKGESDV